MSTIRTFLSHVVNNLTSFRCIWQLWCDKSSQKWRVWSENQRNDYFDLKTLNWLNVKYSWLAFLDSMYPFKSFQIDVEEFVNITWTWITVFLKFILHSDNWNPSIRKFYNFTIPKDLYKDSTNAIPYNFVGFVEATFISERKKKIWNQRCNLREWAKTGVDQNRKMAGF